jgi:hypothetical protein
MFLLYWMHVELSHTLPLAAFWVLRLALEIVKSYPLAEFLSEC